MEPKIVYESIETFKGGISNGYYEPFSNEIHILKGKDFEFRTLIHEKTHASRKNTISFKLATIIQVPLLNAILISVMGALGFMYFILDSFLPLAVVFSVYFICALCLKNEEYIANRAMLNSSKLIKQIGSEEIV